MEATTAARIEALNARFDRMSDEEKLVELCRDILRQIADRNIQATYGNYIRGELQMTLDQLGGDAQQLMPKLEDCQVCMLGAMVLSKVRLFDRTPITSLITEDARERFSEYNALNPDASYCRVMTSRSSIGSILDFVSQYDADRLEAAYEGTAEISDIVRRGIFDAASYCRGLSNPEERMAAIATRVILNEGRVGFPENTSFWLRKIENHATIGWYAPLFYGHWYLMPEEHSHRLTIIARESTATENANGRRVIRTNCDTEHQFELRDLQPSYVQHAADYPALAEAEIAKLSDAGQPVPYDHHGCQYVELEDRVIRVTRRSQGDNTVCFDID